MVELIITISSVLAALVGIISILYRYVFMPIYKLIRRLNRIAEISEELHKIIYPNGGTSVLDHLTRIEESLIKLTKLTQLLSNNIDPIIFETDAKGDYTWVSDKWTKMTGLTISDNKHHGWMKCVKESDKDKVWKEWSEVLERHIETQITFSIIHVYTGIETKLCSKIIPIFCNENNVVGYIGAIEKI